MKCLPVNQTYMFSFEKSLMNLKENGKCGFIVSSKYTKTKYGKALIEYLQNNSKINSFIDFRDLDVFSGIVAYPSIILLIKKKLIPINQNQNYLWYRKKIIKKLRITFKIQLK